MTATITGLTLPLFMLFALIVMGFKHIERTGFDIQEYMEERERQKTLRELARIQHKRETVGVADDRKLFEEEDVEVDDLIKSKSKEE